MIPRLTQARPSAVHLSPPHSHVGLPSPVSPRPLCRRVRLGPLGAGVRPRDRDRARVLQGPPRTCLERRVQPRRRDVRLRQRGRDDPTLADAPWSIGQSRAFHVVLRTPALTLFPFWHSTTVRPLAGIQRTPKLSQQDPSQLSLQLVLAVGSARFCLVWPPLSSLF